jgi:phage-related protein (TIGR01555 family)
MGGRDMTKPHYRLTASGDLIPAIRATDGYQNLVAGLGTSRDKSFGSGYVRNSYGYDDLATAYEVSSVAKAIVDMPAEDSCREWREWQAEDAQISALEAEERRLGLAAKVMEARKWARLFGGAAIYIGTGESNPAMPLNPRTIQRGGLRYLTVLDRSELTADEMQLDPREPGYGLPRHYRITTGLNSMVQIHPSRLALFRGAEYPDRQSRQANNGWGDSHLTAALEKVRHLDSTIANIASLVFEAKIDVVKIKDFTANLRDGGTTYETLMQRRFALAMAAKGINGTLMLDAEEEYSQKSASFSTLPDILDRFMQIVSSAARIPMTRLFRMSPGGLNATGESDMRSYYDDVRKEQTLEIEPAMHILDECLIRSALGNRPDEIHYNWRSLWQPTAKERAENADKLTTAMEKLHRMDVLPEEAIADAAVNALTENGSFPGLEAAVTEYMGGNPIERGSEDDG